MPVEIKKEIKNRGLLRAVKCPSLRFQQFENKIYKDKSLVFFINSNEGWSFAFLFIAT